MLIFEFFAVNVLFLVVSLFLKTIRDRPKSAPYLRLKIAKELQSVKLFPSTVPEKPKKLDRNCAPFQFFNIHSVAKHQKMKGDHFVKTKFRKKDSQCRKN